MGRWRTASSSDEYLRTARQVIHGLQEQLVATVCGSDAWELRSAGLDELKEHLIFKGVASEQADELCQQSTASPGDSLVVTGPGANC